MIDNPGGAVIAISSHVMRGTVGNRAIVFALETLGFETWAVPTIVLPWHPGHGRSTRLTFDGDGFATALGELAASPWRGRVRAVVSGYLAGPAQAEAIAALVTALKADDPDLLYLCDPVIGDEGGLYVARETAEAIRDRLLPLADIATPNRFELAFLAGSEMTDNTVAIKAALALGPGEVVVTSAHPMLRDGTATLFVDRHQALLAEHQRFDNPPNGLGDLFSALFIAGRLAGKGPQETLETATSAVYDAVSRAVRSGSDELRLEQAPEGLRAPLAKTKLRQLMHPARRRKRG